MPQRTRDAAKAKDLLRQAGHGGGLTLTLATTTSYPGMDTAANLFAQQLREAGITVRVRMEPPDTYWTKVFAKADFYTSFFGGIPFLDVARVSLLADAPTNETAWKRPGWDARFGRALATTDEQDRRREFGALQRELRDEGGYVVWGTGDGLDLTSARVTGLPTGPGFESNFIEGVRPPGDRPPVRPAARAAACSSWPPWRCSAPPSSSRRTRRGPAPAGRPRPGCATGWGWTARPGGAMPTGSRDWRAGTRATPAHRPPRGADGRRATARHAHPGGMRARPDRPLMGALAWAVGTASSRRRGPSPGW